MIRVVDLHKHFGGVRAVDGANLEIGEGAITGLIGPNGAVGGGNQMPPWGGTDLLLSTNPLAVAIPAGDGTPVVMDFATTVASMGKIRTVAQRGESMPKGWMVARDGTPLTDPARAPEGLLLPMGEDLIDYAADVDRAANTGQFICALDPAAFGDAAAIGEAVDRVAGQMRGSEVMPGFDAVRVPGDGRAARLADREENGIPIPDALRAALDGIAEETGVAPLKN